MSSDRQRGASVRFCKNLYPDAQGRRIRVQDKRPRPPFFAAKIGIRKEGGYVIRITPKIAIDEREVREQFIRSSGPGGQNVNKVSTAVQIRFDVRRCRSLPRDVRGRLVRLAGSRMTKGGVLVIDARRFRTQERNRRDALDRLVQMIRRAAERPRVRRKTLPTATSRRRRLEEKRLRSETKQRRRPVTISRESW